MNIFSGNLRLLAQSPPPPLTQSLHDDEEIQSKTTPLISLEHQKIGSREKQTVASKEADEGSIGLKLSGSTELSDESAGGGEIQTVKDLKDGSTEVKLPGEEEKRTVDSKDKGKAPIGLELSAETSGARKKQDADGSTELSDESAGGGEIQTVKDLKDGSTEVKLPGAEDERTVEYSRTVNQPEIIAAMRTLGEWPITISVDLGLERGGQVPLSWWQRMLQGFHDGYIAPVMVIVGATLILAAYNKYGTRLLFWILG